jgi:hypothetical protein
MIQARIRPAPVRRSVIVKAAPQRSFMAFLHEQHGGLVAAFAHHWRLAEAASCVGGTRGRPLV